jgi:hypothetical protein
MTGAQRPTAATPDRAHRPLTPLHWFVAVIGAAVLAAGALIATFGDAGTDVVLVVLGTGLVCLLIALVAHRLKDVTVERGKTKVGFGLADDQLTPEVLTDLRATGFSGLAATYSFVHNQLRGDESSLPLKIKLQDELVAIAKQDAFETRVEPAELISAAVDGSPAERVLAYGALLAVPTLASVSTLKQGILESRTGNEQYHALLVAEARLPTLPADEADELRSAVERATYLRDDADRRAVAERILGRPLDDEPST